MKATFKRMVYGFRNEQGEMVSVTNDVLQLMIQEHNGIYLQVEEIIEQQVSSETDGLALAKVILIDEAEERGYMVELDTPIEEMYCGTCYR